MLKMSIGINDNGKVVGLNDATQLLVEIPNKVRDILGIMVAVNLLQKNDLSYLEIIVESYPYPINYKGHNITIGVVAQNKNLKVSHLINFFLKKQVFIGMLFQCQI